VRGLFGIQTLLAILLLLRIFTTSKASQRFAASIVWKLLLVQFWLAWQCSCNCSHIDCQQGFSTFCRIHCLEAVVGII